MSAKLVPTVKTSYTQAQLIAGFVAGWKKQFGALPKKESIGVLYAQNALETGSTASMWNNNLGNVKFVPSKNPDDDNGKQYMMLANVWEIINGHKVIFQPPSQATWFRAFDTLADGVAFQLDFLKNHKYRAAWAAVESGSPAQFAHLLRVAGYYTAPEADYVRAMNAYYLKYMKTTDFENAVKQVASAPVPSTLVMSSDPTVPIPALPDPIPVEPTIVEPPPVPAPSPVKNLIDVILNFFFPYLFKK